MNTQAEVQKKEDSTISMGQLVLFAMGGCGMWMCFNMVNIFFLIFIYHLNTPDFLSLSLTLDS